MSKEINKQIAIYLLLITFVLIGVFFVLSKTAILKTESTMTISEDSIFALADYQPTPKEKKIFEAMHQKFKESGFMPCYRAAYQEILGRPIDRFEEKFAYAASLLVLANEDGTKVNAKKNALRLFMHFIRLNLVDTTFAVRFHKFASNLLPTFNELEIQKLWENYLRTVFGKFAKPEIVKTKSIPDELNDFLNLSEGLLKSAKILIKPKIASGSYQYEYELIPGKSGEEESDFVLKKGSR